MSLESLIVQGDIRINPMKSLQEEREAFIKWAMPSEGRYAPTFNQSADYWLSVITVREDETAKAYGGCTNCYGKGYATTKVQAGNSRVGTWELEPMKFCGCDRGTQLKAHFKRREAELREELESICCSQLGEECIHNHH